MTQRARGRAQVAHLHHLGILQWGRHGGVLLWSSGWRRAHTAAAAAFVAAAAASLAVLSSHGGGDCSEARWAVFGVQLALVLVLTAGAGLLVALWTLGPPTYNRRDKTARAQTVNVDWLHADDLGDGADARTIVARHGRIGLCHCPGEPKLLRRLSVQRTAEVGRNRRVPNAPVLDLEGPSSAASDSVGDVFASGGFLALALAAHQQTRGLWVVAGRFLELDEDIEAVRQAALAAQGTAAPLPIVLVTLMQQQEFDLMGVADFTTRVEAAGIRVKLHPVRAHPSASLSQVFVALRLLNSLCSALRTKRASGGSNTRQFDVHVYARSP